ncbi:MAG TPA: CHAT domain-containing protein [Thermoanaerobaculia bacterium]|nr:CHAT domain-containing protein [Thermoanaerobaculia bacterium]
MIDYEELRIRAFKTGTDRYLLFANGPEAAAAVITLKKPAADYRRELQDLLREEFAGQPGRPRKTSTALKRLGRELFEIILPAPIHACVLKSLESVQKHERRLRVRFDVAPELMDIPFEVVCAPAFDPLGAAALRPAISLVRSLPGLPVSAQRTPQADDPRAWFPLLVLAPAPAGRKALDVRGELEKIRAALPPFLSRAKVDFLHVLGGPDPGSPRPTQRHVSRLLRSQGRRPSAVLVIAHGEVRHGEIVVALERDNGQPDLIPAQVLADLLAQAEGLRLVILNLCLGSQGSCGEPFSGLAQALIAGGIPAVVAMQAEISDAAAVELSPTLLGSLWLNQTVDDAVSNSRQAVATALRTQSEWGSPVLFLHRSCAQSWLFKVPAMGALRDPVAEEREVLERLTTAPSLDDMVLGAHLLRGRGEWDQAAQFASYLAIERPQEADHYRRLLLEAQTELRIQEIETICDALAREGEDPAVGARVAALLNALPSRVFEALSREVEEAGRALQHYDEATRAMQRLAWAEVREHCDAILLLRPGGYKDVQELLQRADLELNLAALRGAVDAALNAKEWAQALVSSREILALCPQDQGALQAATYATGCIAEREERWEEALQAYGSLLAGLRQDEVAYRDTREREACVRAREDEARARAAEREERRARAVAAFRELAAVGLAADPRAASRGLDPYAALREAKVDPNASAEAVKDASFVLMKQGAMTQEARRAWDHLRSPAGRLRVDAHLYRLQAPEPVRRALQQLAQEPSGDLAAVLGQASPGDAPLFLLLDDRRDEAIAAWERLLAEDPGHDRLGAAAIHGLALATSFQARQLEEDGARELAETAWEKALAAWVAVLSDDAYWETWRCEREERYRQPVTPADVVRLRGELGQQLFQDLAGGGDDERSQALTFTLEIELEGARLLREIGGLPLAGSGGPPLVCGPLHLRHRGLDPRLCRKIAELETADDGREREYILTSLDAALGIGDSAVGDRGLDPGFSPATLFRLRCVFSGLGRPLLLLDRCQPELALRALPPLDPARRAEHQDAVELAVRAHLALARDALEAGALGAAVRRWREAIEVSRRSNSQVRTKRAIVRAVLGRARPLAQERGRWRGECLTAAIELVEQARRLVGADEGQLRDFAAKLYDERGFWYGTGCAEWEDTDYEKAAQDLRCAVQLAPEDLHARENLSRALIFGADGSQDPLKLLAEAVEVLHEGLCRTAGNGRLVHILLRGLDELEGCFLNEDELARRIAWPDGARPTDGPGDAEEARRMVAAAERRHAQGDEPGELKALIAAVRQNSADPAIRRSLLEAVQRQAGLAS